MWHWSEEWKGSCSFRSHFIIVIIIVVIGPRLLIKTHFSLMCFVWCVCCVVLCCVLCLQAPEKLQTGRVVVCRSRVFGLAVGVLLFDGRKTANEIAEEVRTRRDQTRLDKRYTSHIITTLHAVVQQCRLGYQSHSWLLYVSRNVTSYLRYVITVHVASSFYQTLYS